ncbi:alpha/beta fold hydrolase [Sphingomonas sp. BK580]|uniref:S9 family peptidase n=1 Tax=Sphingomonas sp. BK580 TaxID=2586972 RepID=UPI00184CD7C8|nr:alpha/beta fold hydrolase [Sphingomonas sp. BK580]MBB3694654.1 dipeptidyl aminopeptidase/acylaminoacyl peptidase [Sphingomonas sp. BK580]
MVSGAIDASLSPDGRRIAYRTRLTGLPQLWTVDASGGAPAQLTFGAGADGELWSPDGNGLLVSADTGGDERFGLNWLRADGLAERTVLPPSSDFTRLGAFSADGRRYAYLVQPDGSERFDLRVADLVSGTNRLIARGQPGFRALRWSPDGRWALVVQMSGEDRNALWLVDMANGRLEQLFADRPPASYGMPTVIVPAALAWAPDSRGFYMATNEGRERNGLVYVDLGSRQLQWLVRSDDADVVDVQLASGGRYLVWQTLGRSMSALHARDLRSGREIAAPALPAGSYQLSVARDAPTAAVVVDSPRAPGDIYVWRLDSGRVTRAIAASSAGLDMSKMVAPRRVDFRARGGVPLSGLLYEPQRSPAPGRPPVSILLHGGPTDYAYPGYLYDVQMLAARGIAVLDFNYRGSIGEGKSYAKLNDGFGHAHEAEDVSDAVAWLRRQPGLDGTRVAVGGVSYGGYLALAAGSTSPDLFKAVVSEAGPTDWITSLENTPLFAASDRVEYGDIHDAKVYRFYRDLSPLNRASRFRAPLLIRHGVNDPRVSIGQVDAFVQKARAAGVTVRYMRYPGENHGLASVASRVQFYSAMTSFLEASLGIVESPPPAGRALKP